MNLRLFFSLNWIFMVIFTSERGPLSAGPTKLKHVQSVQVRLAEPGDTKTVLELDKRVSYEFFLSLYATYYSSWDFGKHPDIYLEKEIQIDEEMFPYIIRQQYVEDSSLEYRLFGAFDVNSVCRGLLLIQILSTESIELKLFLIDSCCRRMGLGKLLINSMLEYFANFKTFVVYVFQYGNDKTLSFYESLGFKNLGPGPNNKISLYGVPYSEIFYKFVMKK